jgi:hypothetical protein
MYFIAPRIYFRQISSLPLTNSPRTTIFQNVCELRWSVPTHKTLIIRAYFSIARADLTTTDWAFCPSNSPAILFAVLFALTSFAHLMQALIYKKTYCLVIVSSGLLQTICYIFRVVSIKNPNSLGPYAAWFVIILAGLCYAVEDIKC